LADPGISGIILLTVAA
jgi:hypothetical protein